MLAQLIYISSRQPACTDADIEQILKVSRERNKEKNFTGVLLYSKTQFLQVLEGNQKDLVRLYEKIRGDGRHESPILLSLRYVNERTFPSWQMGAKNIEQNDYELLGNLTHEEAEEFRSLLRGDEAMKPKAILLIKRFFK